MLSKISKYCSANWIPRTKMEELEFLKLNGLTNTGKLSELYVKTLLENKNCKYISQPKINISVNKFIIPDFYLPEKDLFIEVKSRSYFCGGTASEKIDHIPRKFSKLLENDKYKNSKLIVLFCAGELRINSTTDLINYQLSKNSYIKNFIELSKKYNIIDWISVNDLEKYI